MPDALTPLEEALARLLNPRLRSVIIPADISPAMIAGIYMVFGFGALYFSDVYLRQQVIDPALLAQLQAAKGGAEVLLTAGLIFVLSTRSRQAIQSRNDRLETLRAERNLLHRVFRHNLRQDTNIIMGYSDLIRAETEEPVVHDYSEKVLDRVERIGRYQDKIVDIERLLESPATPERIDLPELLRSSDYLDTIRESDKIDVTTDLLERSAVIATPIVETAIREVLENAVEHNTAKNPTVSVSIERGSDGLIELIVEDNGPGISDYERRSLESMLEEDLTHSSGLGLWLAKLTCSVSGGTFDIPEQEGDGGKVIMALPEAPERTLDRLIQKIAG